jgi:predicted ATP-grasp superfamily ATP-dependent carboligase
LENARAVEEIVASAREDEVPWVVQEIIPGGDDTLYTFGSCMAHDGRLKGVFTGRKLRQKPPGFGICRVGETVLDRELEQDGTRFLQALGYHGISQVEFKYDARDRRYKLMEVNPRCWVWVGLPIRLGINLPFAFFCDALGLEIPCFEMTSGRALWICLSDDLEVSLAYRDGRPWTHLSKGYDQIVEAYADTSDPLPGLVHAGRTLADYVGRALAKLGKLAGG